MFVSDIAVFVLKRDVELQPTNYRDVLLSQSMLPAIRQLAGDAYVFQGHTQDNAPAHHAPSTVEFLRNETPNFIPPDLWPPCSPDLNPIYYKIWGCMQERVYKPICDLAELKQRLVKVWADLEQTIKPASRPKDNILNIYYNFSSMCRLLVPTFLILKPFS